MTTTTTTQSNDLNAGDRVRFSESILGRVRSIGEAISRRAFEEIKDARGTVVGETGHGRYAIDWDGQHHHGFADAEDLENINRTTKGSSDHLTTIAAPPAGDTFLRTSTGRPIPTAPKS